MKGWPKKEWARKTLAFIIFFIGYCAVVTLFFFLVEPSSEVVAERFRAEKERMSLVERPLKEFGFDIIEMHRSGHRVESVEEGDVFYNLTVRMPKGSCVVPLAKVADAYEKDPSGRLLLISYYPISLKPDWNCRAHASVRVQTQNKYLER